MGVTGSDSASQVTFESLDACAEAMVARNVDVELLQLGPGSGTVSIRTTPCRLITVQRIRIDAPAIRRGSLDPAKASFVVWDQHRPQEGVWCGRPLGTAGLSLFPQEFAATGKHRLDGTVIEVEVPRCLELAALLEIDLPKGWRNRSVIYPLDKRRLVGLSRNLASLESGLAEPGTELEVLSQLVAALDVPGCQPPRANLRARAFAAAREHLVMSGPDVPTVPELCRTAGVSLRTLEYAFRDRVGMTPIRYLKVYRLNQVRQMLRQGKTRTVVDAANAWGFWHMGKFASDYRQVFGVTPSCDLPS